LRRAPTARPSAKKVGESHPRSVPSVASSYGRRLPHAGRLNVGSGDRWIRPTSVVGHFETKSEAESLRVSWSDPPTGADVLALGKQGRRVRLVHPFYAASTIVVQLGAISLSASPISKLRATDDERRQAKRNSPTDKLAVEAKALADLKVEKATIDGERRMVEADLGPVRYLAALIGAGDQDVMRWFILAIALLLDPAAVLLLLAATRR